MGEFTINGVMLRDMLLMGASVLEHNKASIDALNVFPVPDGDTGTNMLMTMQSAAKSIKSCSCESVSEVADALSNGALRGARGNSGVILSQIFRGFSKALKGEQELTAKLLVKTFTSGTESAYKAVMRPKEGTMLTVIRMISEALIKAERSKNTLPEMIDVILSSGEAALKKTPDLLPVLKEAGVVDSGGMGLLAIFRGFKMALEGEVSYNILDVATEAEESESTEVYSEAIDIPDTSEIKYGYCTELFIINLFNVPTDEEIDKLREKLSRIGDSVVVAFDEGFVKIHVHTSTPGKVLQLALCLGELQNIKIENMLEQNREMHRKLKSNEKEYAIVTVCAGEGIKSLFNDLGVHSVITGGQTMNPSIESIEKAIKRSNAKNVFILPNNSNIILAAQQAAALTNGRNIVVIPTKSIMQGISAVMAFNNDLDAATNVNRMNDALNKVISGAVTYSVRSTDFEGKHINEGDIIGILNNKIEVVGTEIKQVSLDLLKAMIDSFGSDDPIVTVLFGEDINQADADDLVSTIEGDYEDAEFIHQYGGQPLYYYYFSVE